MSVGLAPEDMRLACGQIGRVAVARLAPGTELLAGLAAMASQAGITSGLILGGAASLRSVCLRNVKNQPAEWPITDRDRVYTTIDGPLELLSISGNFSARLDGAMHIHAHVVVSTSAPRAAECFGGHLVEGAVVLSTAEIAIAELTGAALARRSDPQTKALELYPL